MYSIDCVLRDYFQLGQAQAHTELKVVEDPLGNHLGISENDHSTVRGFFQSTFRNVKQLAGFASVDQLSLFQHIHEMNANMTDYLTSNLSDIHSLSNLKEAPSKLKKIETILTQAKKGLEELQKIYATEPAAVLKWQNLKTHIQTNLTILQSIQSNPVANQAFELPQKENLPGEEKSEESAKSSLDINNFIEIPSNESKEEELLSSFEVLDLSLATYTEAVNQSDKGCSSLQENSGSGPTFIGKIFSATETLKEMAKNALFPFEVDVKDIQDPTIKSAIRTLANSGLQLNSAVVSTFLTILQEEVDFSVISNFYTQGSTSDYTKEQILATLKRQAELEFLDGNKKPICIPLVFGVRGLLERQHITIMMIKDGEIHYYDSKGMTSDKQILKDGASFREILESSKALFLKSEDVPIYENKTIHQYDAHRCGMFVLYYLIEILKNNKPIHDFNNRNIPITMLDNLRRTLMEEFKNYDCSHNQFKSSKGIQEEEISFLKESCHLLSEWGMSEDMEGEDSFEKL